MVCVLLEQAQGGCACCACRMSSYKLRAKLAKHTVRFFGTGGTSTLLQRIKWASQLHARPPTFMLQLRGSSEVDEKNQRFLENLLRQTLDLDGVPLRLRLRYVCIRQHNLGRQIQIGAGCICMFVLQMQAICAGAPAHWSHPQLLIPLMSPDTGQVCF